MHGERGKEEREAIIQLENSLNRFDFMSKTVRLLDNAVDSPQFLLFELTSSSEYRISRASQQAAANIDDEHEILHSRITFFQFQFDRLQCSCRCTYMPSEDDNDDDGG